MRPLLNPRVVVLVATVMLSAASGWAAAKWRPIPPEELNATPPAFDPTAGAVILLRDINIDCGGVSENGFEEGEVSYFVRIKVFDRKGIDAVLQLQIPYEPDQAPRGLAARVVKADGSTVEVERSSIYTRDAVRVGRESVRVKAFSFPALEPGCIVEYQYRVRPEGILGSMQVPMSDNFPVAVARVKLEFLQGFGLATQLLWSGLPTMTQVELKKRTSCTYEARAIPVAAEEPYSPPETSYKPWLLFYVTQSDGSAREYWSYVAGDLAFDLAELIKPKKPVKDAALRLTSGIVGDEAKLQRLYDFCRTEIKNLSYDNSGYTPDEIENLKPNRGPADTLTHGYGTSLDINILFGAMLKAMGADPSFAYVGDRSRYEFSWNLKLRAALPHVVVAMSIGSDYRFYDPGAMYLPCGQLRWMNDGTSAIVIYGAKEKFWKMIEIPRSGAEYSTTRRTGNFRLSEAGDLEGDVTIELTGHDGIAAKHEYDTLTEDQRRKSILDALVARLGPVEIEDLAFENVTDPNQSIRIRYHVKAAAYGETTAGRLIVQPAFFQKGLPTPFTAATRVNGISFPYAYTTRDEITIDLPAGLELEEPNAPAPVNVNGLLLYVPRIEYARRAGRLTFTREFTFDGTKFLAVGYDLIKHNLERVTQRDAHALALRRTSSETEQSTSSEAVTPPATPY